MYSYFIIVLLIIIVLYLVKSKVIETLVPEPVIPNPSDNDNNITLQNENNARTTEIYGKQTYLTENKINYDLLDSKIDTLMRQYNALNYNYQNFQFQLGKVITGTNPNSKATMTIGGSFPNNVQLSFYFPPPLPGVPGQKGEPGDSGETGKKGLQGKQGQVGPFGTCPK